MPRSNFGIHAALLTTIFLVTAALPAFAQDDTSATAPVNLALWAPVQTAGVNTSVAALRVSLFYGRNADVSGLDLSLVGRTTGDGLGLQWALVGLTDGDFTGWSDCFYSRVGGRMSGLQTGAVNLAESAGGLQFGLVNRAGSMSGLQVGVVNIAAAMESGLQIGVVNVIENKDRLPVLPIVNWRF